MIIRKKYVITCKSHNVKLVKYFKLCSTLKKLFIVFQNLFYLPFGELSIECFVILFP